MLAYCSLQVYLYHVCVNNLNTDSSETGTTTKASSINTCYKLLARPQETDLVTETHYFQLTDSRLLVIIIRSCVLTAL